MIAQGPIFRHGQRAGDITILIALCRRIAWYDVIIQQKSNRRIARELMATDTKICASRTCLDRIGLILAVHANRGLRPRDDVDEDASTRCSQDNENYDCDEQDLQWILRLGLFRRSWLHIHWLLTRLPRWIHWLLTRLPWCVYWLLARLPRWIHWLLSRLRDWWIHRLLSGLLVRRWGIVRHLCLCRDIWRRHKPWLLDTKR